MGDPQTQNELQNRAEPTPVLEGRPSELFGTPPQKPAGRMKVVFVAVAALALVAIAFFLHSGKTAPTHPQNTALAADPYAPDLAFTQLAMSESTSLSGGKSTFIDGHVRNTGPATLKAVTMQVLFRNDVGLSPQVVTLPLTLIRTHEPYVDTEPVSAAPLKPGDEAEFRLILEGVSSDWNQQMPELAVVHVAKR